MSPDPVADPEAAADKGVPLTRPRPGHADLTGMQKYGFDEARPVLERASARETAARVAAGAAAKALLAQVGVGVVSHVVRLGPAATRSRSLPTPADLEEIDASPVRCLDGEAEVAWRPRSTRPRRPATPSAGCSRWSSTACLPASGPTWDRKLDARLAGALMSIQAIKGVEVGDGFATAAGPGRGPTTPSSPGPAPAPCGAGPGGPGGSRAACPPARPCGSGRP